MIKLNFKKNCNIATFETSTKDQGLYICMLGTYVGYIGISENVSERWTGSYGHIDVPKGKWPDNSIKGFQKDPQPFQRTVQKNVQKMVIYTCCGRNSAVKRKRKRSPKQIIDLSDRILLEGIESILIYKQSQKNEENWEIKDENEPYWGSRKNKALVAKKMLLNKDHLYKENRKRTPNDKTNAGIDSRKYIAQNFGEDSISIEGLPAKTANFLSINRIKDAVDAYFAGEKIR